ncbi:hypothetical protein ASG96_22390 [Terrabacter sp. Soil810]|nr:hypothetical protein ASG96_22390 [Terrabacter sp. Soil810]
MGGDIRQRDLERLELVDLYPLSSLTHPGCRCGQLFRETAPALERWDLAPAAARVRGDEGNRRLHQRWARFMDRRKRATTANVAIARELAGWGWSLAVLDDQ